MKSIQRPFVKTLRQALQQQNLIQVVLGPRQVGKTTGVKQLLSEMNQQDYVYVSADGNVAKESSWILEQWAIAKTQCPKGFLVIDEVQKIENWSEVIKKLWDEQSHHKEQMKLILLGSSSLSIQSGLSESLAGRYFLHKVYHWSPQESLDAYGMNLNDYLLYGGYPGSYPLLQDSKEQWLTYIKESIVEAVIAKDILSQARIKSPVLFKQCFMLACSYPAQEISYTKLLGQLQEKGNVELVKYYLELFEGAFLLKQLFKYSNKAVLMRSSSPKILPLCPALYSITEDADLNAEEKGRSFELTCGMLLNQLPGRLHYWRQRNAEVDFVYQYGKNVFAIEVKSGQKKSVKGLEIFKKEHPRTELKIMTPENYEQILNELRRLS